MRKRTRARELALQMLYQVDVRGDEVLSEMGDFLEFEAPGEEQKIGRASCRERV